MSQENVELVRGLQPSRDTDLVATFRDDATAAAVMETLSPFFHEDVEIVAPSFVAGEGVRFVGLEGLRAGWRAGMTVEVSVTGGAVWTVRDGRVVRVAFYLNR